MLFSVVSGIFLLASSVAAVPSNLEKKNYNVVYKTIIVPQNAAVVKTTVYVNGYRPRKHGHSKSKAPCTTTKLPSNPSNYNPPSYNPPSYNPQPVSPPVHNNPPSYNPPPVHNNPPSSYGGSSAPAEFQEMLNYHNQVRNDHGAGPLTWSAQLAQSACDSTQYVGCEFEHHPNGNGENLASGYPTLSPINAVKMWYGEANKYNYNNPGFSSDTGHFTQVCWKETTQMGCCSTECNPTGHQANIQIRCQYSKAGNMLGAFRQNVLPPRGGGYRKL